MLTLDRVKELLATICIEAMKKYADELQIGVKE